MECLKIFDNYKLSDLNEDWIQSVWDGEFLIYNEPPDEYLMFLESEDMSVLLHKSSIALKAWLEGGNDPISFKDYGSDISWNTLITMNMKVHALLAVLGYIIKSGHKKASDEESRQTCLYATNLYFVLLTIPGSNAFNVFHPNLYQQAIETLKISSEQLQPCVKKRNKAMNMADLNITDELMNEQIILSSHEKQLLIKNLNIIICSLIMMIKSFWFKNNVQSLDITIRGLLAITKIEDDFMTSQYYNKRAGTLEISLPQNAYAALQELCDNKHGPVKVTITLIAKYVLPRLLCSHVDTQIKIITNIQEHTINFLKVLLNVYDKEAKTAILTLIQHVMLNCPDRLEARQRQASVLIKLFGICKQSILIEAFKDLILFTHHSKVSFRVFAKEVVGKLLLESLINCNLTDALKLRMKKVFFAVVLCRCMDCSSLVRGKAMAIIAELTESNNKIDSEMFQLIFGNSDTDKQFVTFYDLKDAVCNDTDLLPGINTLITMLTDRIEDDRAMVRKSALQIFKNLCLMTPSLMDRVISIMSCRCRDPTLTVRRFAVQVLSQLLEQFPENSQLLNEWVQTVVPQIFDVEIKVQEKVLEYLEVLLLRKIQNVSLYNGSSPSNLPWNILTTLTNRKMRRHLSKACNLWIKNGIVTDSKIKDIQSHIGTNNNTETWIFLAALAENTNLPNMNKYFRNYKEIFTENSFYTNLVLHVLQHSWKSLDHHILECLHVYLFECLQEYKINFYLIGICLDVMHNIVQFLNPDKNNNLLQSNMEKLIKISEMEIAKSLKSDSDAVAAAPNYLKAMFTLGHATLFTASKVSPLTLRILQGILLQWETLPDVIKKIKELQASAIVILGQQAIRDRETAKEVAPIFGMLLRQETDLNSVTQTALKINAAKALADICMRFTALAEPYLSDMCVSMKNSSPQVREAILVIFIQLLLEDFIKVKGPFFFHILTMLSDSDSMIRELTIFLIEERLLTKNKHLISQQFLQSIYHYNNFQSQHKIYHHMMRENEKIFLTLPGKRNEHKRRAIYNFMLDHLDPPGKIKLLVKVTSQILGGFCVDSIDVRKEETACVLKDALYIISNDRLRPSSFIRHSDDDQQDGEEFTHQTTTTVSNAVNVIVEGIKKHGLEVLLPILIKLRMKLSLLKSPIEYYARNVLIKTYSRYNKDQLINVNSEYPQLEKEVEQFKKQVEDIRSDEEMIIDEVSSLPESNNQSASNKNLDLSSSNLYPKVMLEQISMSRILNGKRLSVNSPSPISISNDWSSTSATPILHSPCEPGPSTSTPKSFRRFDFDSSATVGQTSKARRLSTYFQNEKDVNSLQHKFKKRNIFHVQDDSESD